MNSGDTFAREEQRTVIVSTRPDLTRHGHEAITVGQVRAEIEFWGRAPINLERVRSMLVELERRMTPYPARVASACHGCGFSAHHSPSCPVGVAIGAQIIEVAP